jgi:histidine ammonia-lyase
MGWTAVRKLREVVANVRSVLAVELLCGAQSIDLRAELALPGPATAAVHSAIRREVPFMGTDREVAPQIKAVSVVLGDLVTAAEAVTGGLA